MAKRTGSGASTHQVKKKCGSFKMESCRSMCKRKTNLWNLVTFFLFRMRKVYSARHEAKVAIEFSEGKMWLNWKLEYLKRHTQLKSHLKAVGICTNNQDGTGAWCIHPERAQKNKGKRTTCHTKQNLTPSKLKFSLTIFYLPLKWMHQCCQFNKSTWQSMWVDGEAKTTLWNLWTHSPRCRMSLQC